MRKNALTIIMCLVMVLTILAGCGKISANADERPDNNQNEQTETVSAPQDQAEEQKQRIQKILRPDLADHDSDGGKPQTEEVDDPRGLGDDDHVIPGSEIGEKEAIGFQNAAGKGGRHFLGFIGILIDRNMKEGQ